MRWNPQERVRKDFSQEVALHLAGRSPAEARPQQKQEERRDDEEPVPFIEYGFSRNLFIPAATIARAIHDSLQLK